MVGIDYVGIVANIDYVVYTNAEVHTMTDTSSDTDWVGIVQADRMLVLVHPEVSHHSSSTRC